MYNSFPTNVVYLLSSALCLIHILTANTSEIMPHVKLWPQGELLLSQGQGICMGTNEGRRSYLFYYDTWWEDPTSAEEHWETLDEFAAENHRQRY